MENFPLEIVSKNSIPKIYNLNATDDTSSHTFSLNELPKNIEIITPNNHLRYLEDMMKNEKIKDNNFTLEVIKSILAIEGREKLISLLKNRLDTKKLIFLRHAQAEHNEYNIYHRDKGINKPRFYDPQITSEGAQQCEDIKNFIKSFKSC